MTLDDLLATKYVRGARGDKECDCYGLVRHARFHLFGKSLLPAHGHIDSMDKVGMTETSAHIIQESDLERCEAKPGAIAAAYSARLCTHVGLIVQVDGRLWVLETDEPTGPCLTPLKRFESRFSRVFFYDDKNLS